MCGQTNSLRGSGSAEYSHKNYCGKVDRAGAAGISEVDTLGQVRY